MSNTAIAYQFDGQGYYLSETLVQKMGDDYLIPSDTTMTKPTFKDGYWTKWNGKKWILDTIPSTCQEAIDKGLTCISNGQGKHNYEVKTLLENLVKADEEHYKTVVSDDFVMSIEAIPEKTLEEVKKAKQDELSSIAGQYDQYKCDTMYITSSVGGYRFNADIRSQTNIQGLVSQMASDEDTTLYKDYDNEFKNLTKTQLKIIYNECILNGENLYKQKWTYQAQIEACQTKEEVEAIKIEFEMMDFSK